MGITQVAEAITTHISGSTYSIDLTVSRKDFPVDAKASLSGNLLYVVPAAQQFPLEYRKATGPKNYEIDIILKSDVSDESNSTLDSLIEFTEELVDDLKSAGPMSSASLISAEQDTLFDRTELSDNGVFLSVITLTYKGC